MHYQTHAYHCHPSSLPPKKGWKARQVQNEDREDIIFAPKKNIEITQSKSFFVVSLERRVEVMKH